MDCIIIDDEKMARVIIKTLCDQVNSLNLVHEFSNAIQAIKYLNEHKVDLVFLDIHMPNFSGLDFVKTIKNPPKIILTTSVACMRPTIPGRIPRTPPSAQLGTKPGGGGSGYKHL